MRAIACRASVARQGPAPHRINTTARSAHPLPRRRCFAPPFRCCFAPLRCTLRLHLRRSQRAPRCSAGAAPDKAAPADDGAEEALGRAMLLGVAAAYGSLTVACRYVFLLPGPPAPSVMAAVRGIVAALCFAPLLAKERRELASEPPFFWRAAAELTAYNALYEGLLNLSVVHTDATRAGFLFESSVLFTPALATLTGARVAPTTWAAAAAAVCGVALLAGDNVAASGLTLTAGDAEALAAALAYSCYVLRMSDFGASGLSTDLTQGVKCILMAAVYLGWAGVDVALASAVGVRTMDELGAALWPGVASGAAWAALLYSGVVPGAVADVLQARGQAKVRAAEAQVLLSAEPLWTAVLGAALLHEHMSPQDWAGAALIVGAVAVSSGLTRRLAAALRREWRRRQGLLPADEEDDGGGAVVAAAALPPSDRQDDER